MGDRWDEKKIGVFGLERRPNQLVAELAEAGHHPRVDHRRDPDPPAFRPCRRHPARGGRAAGAGFPKARHWVQKRHWEWAGNPSERDRASFRRGGFRRPGGRRAAGTGGRRPGDHARRAGHARSTATRPASRWSSSTPARDVVVYCGDLLPFLSQVHVPWIMGFDLNPLLTVTEKKQFLTRAVEDGYILVFEHDTRATRRPPSSSRTASSSPSGSSPWPSTPAS